MNELRFREGENGIAPSDCPRSEGQIKMDPEELKQKVHKLVEEIRGQVQEIESTLSITSRRLTKLETTARRLVDHANNSKQEDWASLPDVLALEAALPPISASSDKWCLYQDQCRHSGSVNQADSECNSCITHCNFEWKE